ncbi:MAG: hypothetical protein JWQ78_49 [Sediminibacterium sp.]|nr:hypothetical protein [Sediminibacterium sp.]
MRFEYGALYFYTSSIHNWRPLIRQYDFYETITNSLLFLHKKGMIRIYGFVIMPNHIHLVWQLLKSNGKETPVASLMKFTAHTFEQYILQHNPSDIVHYAVDWRSRKYNFWQPEPHWFLLYKERTTVQKINYIHNNPLQEHWRLAESPVEYPFSSARFYETGEKNFEFLYHYKEFDDDYKKR